MHLFTTLDKSTFFHLHSVKTAFKRINAGAHFPGILGFAVQQFFLHLPLTVHRMRHP
jgi:hypothetical protein